MQHKAIGLIIIMLIIAGCATASDEEVELTSQPVITLMTATPQPQLAEVTEVVEESTEEVVVNQETDNTATGGSQPQTQVNQSNPVSVSVASSANIATTTCTVRNDLPAYTVVAGDTLFSIASRAATTVDNIVSLNCLANRNLIEVGQQLRVPSAINSTSSTTSSTTTSSNNTTSSANTSTGAADTTSGRQGTIVISPWQTSEGNRYTINTTNELDIRWQGVPTDLGLTQVDFIYDDALSSLPPILIGIDDDLSDGARVSWNAPEDINGSIYASARLPNQLHQGVSSNISYVTTDNTPLVVGPRGALSVDPNLQAGTPQDWSDYIVEAGQTVTVRWTGVDPEEYNTIASIQFDYIPDNGERQLIAVDSNRSDGMSVTWTVPQVVSGSIVAEGLVEGKARIIFSPDIHVRTLTHTDGRCEFNPFGIGGDIPVYRNPDTGSQQLGQIQTGTTYPILAQGGTWTTDSGGSGIFYEIPIAATTGWVQDARGSLLGDCSNVPVATTDTTPDFACSVTPPYNTGLFQHPDGTTTILETQLLASNTYEVIATSPHGWYRMRAGNSEGWAVVDIEGACDNLPVVYYACLFVASTSEPIYATPDLEANQLNITAPDEAFRYISTTGDWYEILYRPQRAVTGYVLNTTGRLEGNCD